MVRNKKGKISKTKLGSIFIGAAGTLEAIAQVPSVPVSVVVWVHVASISLGAIGAALGGVGIRDALEK